MRSFLFALGMTLMSVTLYAQDCSKYYYINSNEVQMTMYDKKDKESGKLTYKISDKKKEGGNVSAIFNSEIVDEKGKLISKNTGTYKCNGGVMFIDARVSMPSESMSAYKDMEVKANDAYIEYPSTFTEGATLKDVDFKMEMSGKSGLNTTITLLQTNRKVVGKESITTAAGTWECWKITYDAKMKTSVAPLNIGPKMEFDVAEWFAPGFGIVKTVTMRNGKVMGSTAITSVK